MKIESEYKHTKKIDYSKILMDDFLTTLYITSIYIKQILLITSLNHIIYINIGVHDLIHFQSQF